MSDYDTAGLKNVVKFYVPTWSILLAQSHMYIHVYIVMLKDWILTWASYIMWLSDSTVRCILKCKRIECIAFESFFTFTLFNV